MYRATVKINNLVKQFIEAMAGTLKQRIYSQILLLQKKLLDKYFVIFIHQASKEHKCHTHHYLGNTKARIHQQEDTKIFLLCLHE